MSPKQIVTWVASILASGGAIGLVFWGVPYYIDVKVSEKLSGQGPSTVTTEHAARLTNVEGVVTDIRTMMIADRKIQAEKDKIFMDWLAAQAN